MRAIRKLRHWCFFRSRGDFGFECAPKYAGAPTIGCALIDGHSHGNHVALGELTTVNDHVEVPDDKIEMRFVDRGDVEHDIGIGMRAKAPSVGASTIAAANGDTTYAARRTLALFGNLVKHGRDIPKNLAIAT